MHLILRHFFVLASLFIGIKANAQSIMTEASFAAQLNATASLPDNLLSTKSIVLHSFAFTDKELENVQEYCQRAGIDAVAYYPIDMVIAGKDVVKAFSDQFTKRDISNLILLEKSDDGFKIYLTKYNGKPTLIDEKQSAALISNRLLLEALKLLLRTTSSTQRKQNLLINNLPEIGLMIDPIVGKRNEFYAVDMKVDLVAIPKFGDEAADKELEQIIAANFPFKYKLTEPNVPEKELRKQGMLYVMCYVHTRASVAKELLGYNVGKSESGVVSVTYPEGAQVLKNFPANTSVYKIYFKHIDSGNVFLGNKWDADLTWQSALLNQIRGMKTELRLN